MQLAASPLPSGSQQARAQLKVEAEEDEDESESESEESEDGHESGMIDNRWIRLAFFLMYELLLVMTFLYQLRAKTMFLDGDDSMRGPCMFAGYAGMLIAGIPLVMMMLGAKDGIKRIWSDWAPCFHDNPAHIYLNSVVTVLISLGFFCGIAMLLGVVTSDVAAGLTQVDQVLHAQPSCQDGRLLLVEELLNFDMPTGFAYHAKRSLPNQIEPKVLGFDNVHNVPGLRLVSTEKQTKHAWDLDYESGQLTTLRFAFDIQRKAFQVRLRYLAQLRGSSEPCQKGGAVCNLTDGRSSVKGWWDVCVPEHVGSSLKVGGCATPDGCEDAEGALPFSATPIKSSSTQYDVEMEVPRSVGIGTETCPLAWELATRNFFWVAGSALLVGAMGVCICGFSVPGGGKGVEGVLLVTAAIAGAFALLACLCFGLALTWDCFTTEY